MSAKTPILKPHARSERLGSVTLSSGEPNTGVCSLVTYFLQDSTFKRGDYAQADQWVVKNRDVNTL